MTTVCERHYAEVASGQCRACRQSFCDRCLVRVGRSPTCLCLGCALQAAGVRPKQRYRRLTWRERRARRRQVRQAVQQAREREAAAREPVSADQLKCMYWRPGREAAPERAPADAPTPPASIEWDPVEPVAEVVDLRTAEHAGNGSPVGLPLAGA
jgi:hypothetical protein